MANISVFAADLTTYVLLWSAAAWGCCYSEASCAGAWGNSWEKSPARAWEKRISSLSWTFHAATGFPAGISLDPRWAMGLEHADYPLQGLSGCPGLSSAEPFSWSTLYSWPQSRTTWLPGLFPVSPLIRVREKMSKETGRIQLLLVHSAPASVSLWRPLGVDQESALPRRSLFNVTLLPQPQPKITDELWRLGNMEGSHRASSLGFCQPCKAAC